VHVVRASGPAASTVDEIRAGAGVTNRSFFHHFKSEDELALASAGEKAMSTHIADLTHDVGAAKRRYAPDAPCSAESVGYFVQSILRGAFIFAKAKQVPEVMRESLARSRRYLGFLFNLPRETQRKENHELCRWICLCRADGQSR
jgi:AcrR family transcriptional regulator